MIKETTVFSKYQKEIQNSETETIFIIPHKVKNKKIDKIGGNNSYKEEYLRDSGNTLDCDCFKQELLNLDRSHQYHILQDYYKSKFLGHHYWPKNLKDKYPKDEYGNFMSFLAQINFKELPANNLFPIDGILQFFISAEDTVYGLNFENPTEQKNFKIIYWEEQDLIELKDNKEFLKNFILNNPIIFNKHITKKQDESGHLPIDSELDLKFERGREYCGLNDQYYSQKYYQNINITEDEEESFYELIQNNGHKMGGFAFFTQSDPRLNITNGQKIEEDHIKHENNEWVLLMQIDSDDKNNIMWGDVGVANWFIKAEDLKKMDFSSVLYNWDCY